VNGREKQLSTPIKMETEVTLAIFQALALLLGGVFNAVIAYEAYKGEQKWWRIAAAMATAFGLVTLAGFKMLSIY
jgi:hypothetical protein